MLIAAGLCLAASIVTIVAALKMKRLESYGLAITASILAILVSPSNLVGLAIGIWSLVVLSRPSVVKAFERTRRMKPPRPPVPAMRRVMGIVALLLCLAAVPLNVFFERSFGSFRESFFVLFVAPELIALICGIIGWRSLTGKFAVVIAGLMLLLLGPLWASRAEMADRHMAEVGRAIAQFTRGGPWIAKLPNGVTVELVGVRENKHNGRWWRPDGLPLEYPPYVSLEAGVAGGDVLVREFAARLGGVSWTKSAHGGRSSLPSVAWATTSRRAAPR